MLLNKTETVSLKANEVKRLNVDLSKANSVTKKVVLYT